jgi:hypothetical protein
MLHSRSRAPKRPDPSDCLAQVDRLASSSLLQSSDALCRLMRYLAEHSLKRPTEHLKEYQIATEVLGRSHEFDPHSDSSVRVQVGRLRGKLSEYYASEGQHDPVLVELPKGRYVLTFQRNVVPDEPALTEEIDADPRPAQTLLGSTGGFSGQMSIAVAIAACALAAIVIFSSLSRHPGVVSSVLAGHRTSRPETPLGRFWSPFIQGQEESFVVFKNMTFVGDVRTGMHRFDPARDSPNQLIERYTGIGEVMGVLELDQLFAKLGGHFRVKRAGIFTLDDARDHNLVFVGSPDPELDLNEIPGTREFTFRRVEAGPGRSMRVIVDNHPHIGAAQIFPSPSGKHPVETAYAIVALERGLDPSHRTLFLEGTTTIATQAAVDYVCSEDSMTDLLNRLQIGKGADLKPFEALLEIKIANDVPVVTQLLDLRRIER